MEFRLAMGVAIVALGFGFAGFCLRGMLVVLWNRKFKTMAFHCPHCKRTFSGNEIQQQYKYRA